jgi:pyruvate,water dikinase
LFRVLGSQGVRVLNRFAFASPACYDTLQSANTWTALQAPLDDLDVTDVAFLAKRAAEARRIVCDAICSDAVRRRTLSGRVSSVAQCETAHGQPPVLPGWRISSW